MGSTYIEVYVFCKHLAISSFLLSVTQFAITLYSVKRWFWRISRAEATKVTACLLAVTVLRFLLVALS